MITKTAHSRPVVAALIVGGLLAGCARPAPEAAAESARTHAVATASAPLSIALHAPREGLYSAGQPAESDWAGIAARGVTTIINLRPASEMQGRDEASEVRAAGMRYVEIPVADGASITRANARKLHEAIGSANGTPVLVHCASANRSGGLLALAMASEQAMPAERALAFGRAAGMKGTEAAVQAVLATPCTASETRAC